MCGKVLKYSFPKARKEHRCKSCRATIDVGDIYHRQTSSDGGEVSTLVLCLGCNEEAEAQMEQGGNDCFDPADIIPSQPEDAFTEHGRRLAMRWAIQDNPRAEARLRALRGVGVIPEVVR
jgi:RNase P subunit RPR2